MTDGIYRIGVVGASSLAGKELGEELAESTFAASSFVLLDEEEAVGQITAAGDEPAFIQRLDNTSFNGLDLLFFAGSGDVTRKYWKDARRAGASIIDLSYALESEADVLVQAPWVVEAAGIDAASASIKPDLGTPAVVAAHPVAVMLALVSTRLKKIGLTRLAATVMEPASEHGREAMDELHQQTVNLLSFQTLPREQYDAQVAFNLLPSLGEDAKVSLKSAEARMRRHYAGLAQTPLSLQMVQAPIFHGYVASVLVEFEEDVSVEKVEAALAEDHMDVVSEDSDPPSNLSAAGQEDIMIRVGADGDRTKSSRTMWLWLAADNLKFAALNGIACAMELSRLRPRGKVQ